MGMTAVKITFGYDNILTPSKSVAQVFVQHAYLTAA
jgi:hypothetical protein